MLTYVDFGMLLLRLVVGLLFVGHGAQKVFGWFGGKGMAGHTAIMERLGMRPARLWAWTSALGELLGGLGLTLGLLTPLAATLILGSMLVAIVRVHWPKGLWNGNGGIEFPLTLAAVAFVTGLTGPGMYSLDYASGLALPEPATYLAALAAMVIVVAVGVWAVPRAARQQQPGPKA
jgi:putative oxidoreductase